MIDKFLIFAVATIVLSAGSRWSHSRNMFSTQIFSSTGTIFNTSNRFNLLRYSLKSMPISSLPFFILIPISHIEIADMKALLSDILSQAIVAESDN